MSLGNNGRSQNRDYKVIAKPLPSRPTPSFLHHGLNHTHLHSLLAHCRSPYIGGKYILQLYILLTNFALIELKTYI